MANVDVYKRQVYEFMSLGAIWILTKGTDVAYSYAELEERTYEDPINQQNIKQNENKNKMLNRLSFLSENDDPQKYKGYDRKG